MSKQNLTRIVGVWWGIVLFAIGIVGMAQEIALEADTVMTVEVGESPVWLTYAGTAGEQIHITTMTAITDTAPDTIIEILYPNGQRLDYADDPLLPDGSFEQNASFDSLELPVDGVYTIRIDSFNGVSTGLVDVLLTSINDNLDVLATQDLTIIRGDIPAFGQLTYDLELSAGQTVSITARDVSNTLDPLLYISNEDGTFLAFNDDHQSPNLTLNALDAHIAELIIDDDMTVRLNVQDYLGRSGTIELMIRRLSDE